MALDLRVNRLQLHWSIYSAHKWGQLAQIYIYGIEILLEAEAKEQFDMESTSGGVALQP